jgi:hypothetical protein
MKKMKKVLLICFVLVGFAVQAQERGDDPRKEKNEMREKMQDLTPQQRAELKSKKMALHLDLNESQQKQIESLLVKQEEKRDAMRAQRKEGKDLTKEELFEIRSQKLDEEIAFKKEFQSILTEEQFAKFEKSKTHRGNMKNHHEKRKKG